jgi:large subunit ribosomal protein L22
VPEAYAILRFSKKLAAKQIHKVLQSAVANAEQRALRENQALDVDQLRIRYAVVNEGPTLKRFTPAAMGRATPIKKRTSHVEIHVVAAAATRAAKSAPAAAAERKRGGKGKAAAAKPAPTKAKAAAAGSKSKRKEGK